MDKEKKTYIVPAVEKSIQILEYITYSEKGRTMKDIQNTLGIAKTTVFSTLSTFIDCSLIRKTQEGLFVPTLKLTALGIKAREFMHDAHFLLPTLEKLRDNTGFTVFFSIYDNGEQIVMEKLDGYSSLVFKAYIGQRKRINTSGSGKAMAAYLTPQELQVVLDKGLDKFTANSISTEKEFLAHLEIIRKQGYAVDDGEGEQGVRCIGAPVFMYKNRLFGAVSIATLNDHLPLSEIPMYAKQLIETTDVISKNLGFINAD